MKKKLLAILFLTATLTSCQDFLNLKPAYQISDQSFYQNQNDFETALVGVYSTFRGLYSGSVVHYIGELTTDNTEIQWSSPSADEMQLDQNAVTATNAFTRSAWNTCLYTISQSSNILNRIDAVNFDQTTKNRIKGEAQFLRAFSYFYLVRMFGNVPIATQTFTSPAQVSAADLTLKPKEEAYKLILADLTSAETLLPATVVTDKTKASQMTVKALLGKVYLTQQNYDLAATKLKEVIDSKQYSLVPDYKTLSTNGNTNLAETLLEIDYLSGQTLGNNYSSLFTPAITSMAIFPNNSQGSGRIVPTLDVIKAYETGDARKSISVNDSVTLIGGKKSYSRYGLKFVDFKAVDPSDGSVSFTILRFADVLLMYAEVLNEQGKTTDALPYINQVRQRAKLPALADLSQADLRLAIERERRVELLYEGHRWFDLVRTGRAQTVLNAHYASQKLNFSVQDFELLFPIPQAEIDLNPKLKQNTGY
ncbi:RagB/SusD family nutrient uptake outer membrane protein [Spirosoma sp. KCTC 42546]|uniref:RagB/SusD family nutrient uptake outer membrane protein n=1 Tax=Spirosoma sp. KCTC 42546 TaxID=2520506 RepID=UPI00115B24E2|nr:RagB/SusD family nutrient uptake outer membrane protein [Spirosoma sp. KCTC 42546]QDK78293.1 RagB/SusD family nutrient uptake outer membrane protein [Spirosoma sp. KCTC 42546]